ncbi:unnamed protein product [Umbelopsis vinacea]
MQQPPSYDYVAHAANSYQLGLYSDASFNSYEQGEVFVTENLPLIDQPPPAALCQDILRSSLAAMQSLDLTQASKDAVLIEDSTTAVFHPRLRPRFGGFSRRCDNNTDVCIQALYPMLGTSQLKHLGQVKRDEKDASPPRYGDEVHYFEVTIVERSKDITMALGLCTRPYPPFRLPGWNRYSVGWHSDDGRKFCDNPNGGQDFSAPWGAVGDVVGCGWQTDNGTVWFTLNGVVVGIAYSDIAKHVFFPAFGADGYCKVKFNFGKFPFKYHFLPYQTWLGPNTHLYD